MKDEKQDDIRNKAQDFANSILECEEYKEFIKNSENLNKNTEAQAILKRFQEKQMELRIKGINSELMDELRKLQLNINQNQAIQDFVKSQDKLVKLLQRTNNLITNKIGMLFAFSSGGGCCG